MGIKHATQTTQPNDPAKDVSRNAWNEDHVIDDGSIEAVKIEDKFLRNDGDDVTSGVLTAEKFIGYGVSPIGSIVGWHKSFTNTPALPDGWVECNGQVLNDSDSVYNGNTIPNLNASGGGERRFLRGYTASGGTGGTSSHYHKLQWMGHFCSMGIVCGPNTIQLFMCSVPTKTVSHVPTYFQVVWIMRVK